MKTNFKRITIGVAAVILATSVLAPVLTSAQTDSQARTGQLKIFCDRAFNLFTKINEKITDQLGKLKDKRDEIGNNIQNRWDVRDKKLEENRAKWDEARGEHFTKLEEKAKTDVQKQALVQFKEVVNNAIKARRIAINSAIETFRKGVEQAASSRKSSIDAMIAEFKNSVKAAYEKAKIDCAAGLDAATIKTNLKTSLKAARDKFVSDGQAVDKTQDVKKQLIDAKKQAMEKAIQDFKAAMEKAKSDLKAAWGEIND